MEQSGMKSPPRAVKSHHPGLPCRTMIKLLWSVTKPAVELNVTTP